MTMPTHKEAKQPSAPQPYDGKPIKVCHVHWSALGVRWKLEQLRDLRDIYGLDVFAIVGAWEGDFIDQLQAEGICYESFDLDVTSVATLLKLPRQIVRLALLFRRERFDVVQSNLFNTMLLCRIASWLADVPVRVVMPASPLHLQAPASRWIDGVTCWMDTALIGSSQITRHIYRKMGVPEDRLGLIYYGPDAALFDPDKIEPIDLRSEYGWGPETRLIGNVAFFNPRGRPSRWIPRLMFGHGKKGQEDIIRAAPQVLREFPEARFLLIGSASSERGQRYLDEMQALVQQLGLEGKVVFPGYRADAPGILRSLDISIQAALAENLGGTVESLLLARPMVATRVGGMVDSVRDGKTGVLVEPGNPDSMAEGILRLLRDPVRAQEMGEAGRRFMLSGFTLRHTVAQLDALYRKQLWRGNKRQVGYRRLVSLYRGLLLLPIALYTLARLVIFEVCLYPLLNRVRRGQKT